MLELKEQKEKLENELRFLKDTLDAGLIDTAEYEKERKRIEDKILEIDNHTEISDEKPDAKVKPSQEKVDEQHEHENLIQIRSKSEEKSAEPEKPETYSYSQKSEQEEKKSSWGKYAVIAVVLIAFIVVFSFMNGNESKTDTAVKKPVQNNFVPVPTISNGEIAVGNENAGLIVITDNDCAICETERMRNILLEMFSTKARIIDADEKDAKNLIKELGITVLPAYILTADIESSGNFNSFRTALVKKGDKYIVSNAASGGSYFFNSAEKKGEIVLYVLEDDAMNAKTDENLREFLDNFEDDVTFVKREVSSAERVSLKNEFGITTFPVMMINNKYKLTGVYPAETVKEFFCKINPNEKCDLALATYLR